MSNSFGYSKYITFKARIGCYAGLSIIPIIESTSRLPILLVTLIVSGIILFIEKPAQRRKVFCIWLAGIITSIFTVMVISIFFIQLILYLVGVIVAAGLLREMSNKVGGLN